MESIRKNNNQLYLDNEFLATLALAKEGILHPVDKLMNQKEAKEVEESGYYKGKPFPFPFIIAPAGEKNKATLMNAQKGETLDLIVDGKIRGFLIVDEVFEVDKKRRIEQLFGTYDLSNPETQLFLKRLGDYAVCGEYEIYFEDIKQIKNKINEAKKELDAKNVAAIMINANPFHRAHERVIRMTLEKYDLLVIFLLKPYKQDILSYDLRMRTLQYFVDNYLPKNRVVIVPFESTYLFSSYKNAILDSICALNYGCNKLILGQHHSGIGAYYDKNEMKSLLSQYEDLDIDIEIIA
ncbi:MAG: sulfate adenylyltransferase, partial [Campylobacterales bacterium]|nr:sulfate adenylyltransferase [Campylobacterales bacterium]